MTVFVLVMGLLANLAFSLPAVGAPEDYETVFAQANNAFRDKDFRQAAKLYEDLVTSGIISADLYYNLGTTFAHLAQTGEAVLYLEKAKKLNPRDPDILANLQLVAPPGSQNEPFILWLPFYHVRDMLSFDEWLWLFSVVFLAIALVGGWILWRDKQRGSKSVWIAGVCVLVCVAAFTGWSYYATHIQRYVVLLRDDEPIYSGPANTFSRLMTAKEGQKFPALKYAERDWKSVVLPTGQVGFVRSEAAEEI